MRKQSGQVASGRIQQTRRTPTWFPIWQAERPCHPVLDLDRDRDQLFGGPSNTHLIHSHLHMYRMLDRLLHTQTRPNSRQLTVRAISNSFCMLVRPPKNGVLKESRIRLQENVHKPLSAEMLRKRPSLEHKPRGYGNETERTKAGEDGGQPGCPTALRSAVRAETRSKEATHLAR